MLRIKIIKFRGDLRKTIEIIFNIIERKIKITLIRRKNISGKIINQDLEAGLSPIIGIIDT